jgi:DNA-binding Xre family transcriptional regulator
MKLTSLDCRLRGNDTKGQSVILLEVLKTGGMACRRGLGLGIIAGETAALKRHRKTGRMSKSDLALNIVMKIETSESPNPTVDTLEKIAKALDVPVAELFK